MNISDGELMEGVLEGHGYEIVAAPEAADVILVNTCAIREHAETRVLGRVGQLNAIKRERPGTVLGVTGCMAQRMGETLLDKAPHVDLVVGPDGYRDLAGALDAIRSSAASAQGPDAASVQEGPRKAEAGSPDADASAAPAPFTARKSTDMPARNGRPRAGARKRLAVLDLSLDENYQGLEQRRRSSVTAWVPIQRGCNHRCTFCIVPYVRGSEKNRDPREVLGEVLAAARSGISEVTLLGQTVNSYAWTGEGGRAPGGLAGGGPSGALDWSFARLLKAVARVPGIRRVRFTSPHPNDVTEELVEVMAGEEAVCEQFHLPVQSGSDRVLRRMLRRYTAESFLEKVRLIRSALPDVALSTDVIVAFPGETEEDFAATLDLLAEVRFDDAFTYRYSPRDGTPATRLPAHQFIDDETGQERLERLIALTRSIQREINEREVGRVEELLIERKARSEGMMLGRTRRAKAVAVPGMEAEIGGYVHARLVRTTGPTFVAERVDAADGPAVRGLQGVDA